MAPGSLAQMVAGLQGIFPPEAARNLLVGLDEPDDAAVYRLDGTALIFTADYFPPVVDEPRAYGAIAAANALSDVYAMGGQPILALNLAAFPDDMPPEVAGAIMRGGAEKVREAGAVIGGGHTTREDEPKYGLAVIGTVAPEQLVRKGGAKPGDVLVLTKPLGVGVVTTALKQGIADARDVEAAVASMATLNAAASAAARQAGVRCGTDITGFGLIGHALEMAEASGVRFRVRAADLAWLPGALRYAQAGAFPGGAARNEEFFAPRTRFADGVEPLVRRLLFSPETSGGLLLAVPARAADGLLAAAGPGARVIGEVQAGAGVEVC
jgi:selenide,water dikinase